ncbi:MAG: ABC transporter substrate-binding protein [Syntrophorhabdales bacterium]
MCQGKTCRWPRRPRKESPCWSNLNFPNTAQNRAFADEFRKACKRYPGSTALYGYVAGTLIAKAFEKAGKVDNERFVDALENLVVDSPIGELQMRGCDHQLILPMYYGITKKSPQYGFLVGSDTVIVSGKDYLPTCDDMAKLRVGGK